MLIQSSQAYKSLPAITPIECPNLVVLSGPNGSGKSQLLSGIAEGIITVLDNGQPLAPIKHVNHVSFEPTISAKSWSESLQKVKVVEDFFARFQLAKEKDNLVNWVKYKEVQFASARKDRPTPPPGREDEHSQQTVGRPVEAIEDIAKRAGKQADELTFDDISMHFPLLDGRARADIFAQDLHRIFTVYRKKWHKNSTKRIQFEEDGKTSFLSVAEFRERHGVAPWELISKIMKEARLEYEVDVPDMDPNAPIILGLTNKRTGANISFGDLSSGEKAIMSLVFSLYNASLNLEFPKLLLMDEPDAHLHPALTKQFFDVIQKLFINEKGMKIILATHSPSTVALAPEEAIYVMREKSPKVKKASKDAALRLLTFGVPTLSVNYECRRQVFVEGSRDQKFYEMVYERLRGELPADISLNFICFGKEGKGKANCDQVKTLVKTLRSTGVGTAFGIIDWDSKNQGNEHVFVLGREKRYTIENYILDPLLLAAFLLRQRCVPLDSFGPGIEWLNLPGTTNEIAQTVADSVIDKIRLVGETGEGEETDTVEYICGLSLKVPKWYLRMKGHELERRAKEAFPGLKKIPKDGELLTEIVRTVVFDKVELVPSDVKALLMGVQEAP